MEALKGRKKLAVGVNPRNQSKVWVRAPQGRHMTVALPPLRGSSRSLSCVRGLMPTANHCRPCGALATIRTFTDNHFVSFDASSL